METKMYDKRKLRRSALVLAIVFALMVVFTILSWGVASAWGDIRITRVSFVGEGGATQSGLMFIPKGVSADNPAPAVINFHGRNCSSYSMINWAMEEARRGYIAFNPDLSGTLETLNTVENTTANLAISAYEYLNALDMVTDISATGHSMGNISLQTLMANPEIESDLNCVVGVGGFFFYLLTQNSFPTQTNYYILEGSKDLYEIQWFGNWEKAHALLREKSGMGNELEFGKLYGDPTEGTAFLYNELPVTHQQQMYSESTITEILNFIGLSSPAPTPIDNTNMVFPVFQLFSAICAVLFIVFVCTLALTFTRLPMFSAIINVPLKESVGKSKRAWILQVATDYIIPILLFVPVTKWVAKWPTDVFKSEWVNQIFFWIVSVALVGAILMVIRYFRKKKQGTALTAVDFGMGSAGEKVLNWKRIGTALFITGATVFVAFTWLDIVITTTGINYQIYTLLGQFNRVTPERILYIIPYLIVCIFLVLVININIATTRRMKTTGHDTRDLVRDIIVNVFLSAGPLTLLMLVEFVGIRLIGNGDQPFNHIYWSALSYGWMFPVMMTSSAAISVFLYRKTGNIWTGVFTSSFTLIFITILNCCATPIVI